jgi:hypothetical protein
MQRPAGMTVFEFVIISSLRAAQLMRGCTPRVLGDHKRIVIAQLEVAGGFVVGETRHAVVPGAIDGGAVADSII